MSERIIRRTDAFSNYFGVGHTKFDEEIAPRLTRVQISKRAVGFTLSSIQKLIKEMVAEGERANAPSTTPARKQKGPRS